MTDLQARLRSHFVASLAAKQATLDSALPALERAARLLAARLDAGHKVLACGNGGSAADAQHFAAELVGRYERERPELAAIALTTDSSQLTAIANDYGYEQVFAKAVRGLGRTGDLLLAISTSGNSASVVKAIEAAQSKGMTVIALTGKDGGTMARMLSGEDVELRAASEVTARVQEVHLLFLHCLCDAVDELLYPLGRA
ncbi:MAG: phosphoheptose isomerase [Stagnimonas sp.]|nr:phosphoheptose isomerase [Stagnimonas sp.]